VHDGGQSDQPGSYVPCGPVAQGTYHPVLSVCSSLGGTSIPNMLITC
jgi:hypothetical protein